MKVYNIPISATLGGATTVATNANFNSYAYQVWDTFGYSIQVVVTGTPTGTFKLQCSADPVPQGPNSTPFTGVVPTNWTDVGNSSQAVSAAGSVVWNVSDAMYNWVRVVYTDGSGGTSTATFTGRFNAKGY
jgi:hypothetical protein